MSVIRSISSERLPSNITAELRGLLEDPLTHLLMARDGVELDEVLRLVRKAQAVRSWRGIGESEPSAPHAR